MPRVLQVLRPLNIVLPVPKDILLPHKGLHLVLLAIPVTTTTLKQEPHVMNAILVTTHRSMLLNSVTCAQREHSLTESERNSVNRVHLALLWQNWEVFLFKTVPNAVLGSIPTFQQHLRQTTARHVQKVFFLQAMEAFYVKYVMLVLLQIVLQVLFAMTANQVHSTPNKEQRQTMIACHVPKGTLEMHQDQLIVNHANQERLQTKKDLQFVPTVQQDQLQMKTMLQTQQLAKSAHKERMHPLKHPLLVIRAAKVYTTQI